MHLSNAHQLRAEISSELQIVYFYSRWHNHRRAVLDFYESCGDRLRERPLNRDVQEQDSFDFADRILSNGVQNREVQSRRSSAKINIAARLHLEALRPTERDEQRSFRSQAMDRVLTEVEIQLRLFIFIGNARDKTLVVLTGH